MSHLEKANFLVETKYWLCICVYLLQPLRTKGENTSWVCCFLTQVVVLVVWLMKKGLPLGALRTSQPAGREPESCAASVLGACTEGASSGDIEGKGGVWLWAAAALCAAAADAAAVVVAVAVVAVASVVFCPKRNIVNSQWTYVFYYY